LHISGKKAVGDRSDFAYQVFGRSQPVCAADSL
jgi:hypothetical protein